MSFTYWDRIQEDEASLHFDKKGYLDQVRLLCISTLEQFSFTIKLYAAVSLLFFTIIAAESIAMLAFMTSINRSSMLGISLAVLFLTIFIYILVKLYIDMKKPEQFILLRDNYLASCKSFIGYQETLSEHHIALAHAATKCAQELNKKQYSYYKPPSWIKGISSFMETISCWLHWHDVLAMRELLLSYSITEHISVLRAEPTNLEFHAALANAYVMLSGLYGDPRALEGYDEDKWIPPQQLSETMKKKFATTAQKAIEEFTILNDYAPNDPWVHSQLSYSYHDLQMPEKEIEQYEILLKILPEDPEILYKLGVLYFQEGMTAKGLRVYEQLRRKNQKKATQLIAFYGG